jgi:hypothetical protein
MPLTLRRLEFAVRVVSLQILRCLGRSGRYQSLLMLRRLGRVGPLGTIPLGRPERRGPWGDLANLLDRRAPRQLTAKQESRRSPMSSEARS